MEKKRMYYFDGKNILVDDQKANTITKSQKFDENFEDIQEETFQKSSNYKEDNPQSTFTKNYDHTYDINFQNFMLSGEYQGHQEDLNEDGKDIIDNLKMSNNNLQNFSSTFKSQDEARLLPEDLINLIKDNYFKTRGYIENKPEVLFEFILDYRSFSKKGLKIPAKVAPVLYYDDEDIYNSLKFYYNTYIYTYNNTYNSVNKKSSASLQGITYDKFKSKFSNETLKRLYPYLKADEDLMKTKSEKNGPVTIDRMVEWLMTLYSGKYRENTNDQEKLFEFWSAFSAEEKEAKGLKWPLGEKNFEAHLVQFFSQEKIIKRLSKLFENICGYECYHPRPLHDYWIKLSSEEKFKKGLNKYDSETLYKFLEDNYYNTLEQARINEELSKETTCNKEKFYKNKYPHEKESYDALLKKFSNLAKPKDRWKTGREMISLRRQFKYDNIIKKMITLEFQSNRVFKFPEEYAVYNKEEMRKILFKNSLEKKIKRNDNDDNIREIIQRAKYEDDNLKKRQDSSLKQIYKEDLNLDKFLRKMCIKYFKLTNNRLATSPNTFTINKFVTDMYNYMLKHHTNSVKRRFPKINNYGRKKSRFSNYPRELKFYFFTLYRRLGVSQDGEKFIFAHMDSMPFWAPAISNKCRIHKNNCPIYCKSLSHNKIIYSQKAKNFDEHFNLNNHKLTDEERLNLWKRKDDDLMKKKSKIFLCLSDAEHCTFEPKLNKIEETTEDVTIKRISNKVWVHSMGENFSGRFPLVYKEGIYKQAKVLFQVGKFAETISTLSTAFNLDAIKAKFDLKFDAIYKKKLSEGKKIENENINNNSININMMSRDDDKKQVEPDNFENPKNKNICFDIFNMLKAIDDYKQDKMKTIKKLKEEINIIKDTKNVTKSIAINSEINKENKSLPTHLNPNTTDSQLVIISTNMNTMKSKRNLEETIQGHREKFIKDKYFNFFKTIMCPLREECPYDIRPRWPHSAIKANVPFGIDCPYAHQLSEIKFEQEIRQKIKFRQNLLKELEKEKDPEIIMDWIPTGPIISCNGCGKTFTEKTERGMGKRIGAGGGPKGLCGFCKYHQKNELDIKNDKKEAEKTSIQILKNISYEKIKAEDWDNEYLKKFGMLKKAAVLYNFKRYTDSLAIMNSLMEIMKADKTLSDEKYSNLDKKWRAKLEIVENIPKEIINYVTTQEVLDYFKIKTPLATLLVYLEKMRKGNSYSIFNRHTYLKIQIDQFDVLLKKTFNRYHGDIKTMKNKINELNTWSSKKQILKKENPQLYNECYRKYRAEMCPNILKKQKCSESYHDCKFAHNPRQLNLTLTENKKKMLKNSIKETVKLTRESKETVAWKYPKQKVYEKGLKHDKSLVANSYNHEKINMLRSKSAGRCKSIDITKMRINYHEI